jgi:tetratricopeptide (TPR) repeat protein
MIRKYFSINFAAALLSLSAVVAGAQTGQLRGHVKFKQADGSVVPAVGAAIDVYRTDMTGKFPTKTDKKGEFVYAGLPYVGTYVIAASMPGARPDVLPNVKAGRDVDYEIILTPGDGKRLTEAEAKGMMATSTGSTSSESAEDKAKREEIEKKNTEIKAKNEKIQAANETVSRTFKAGNDAFLAKNYDEAIKQYDEGLAADPEQPAILTNRSLALKARGVDRYNAAIANKDEAAKNAGLEAAKSDFKAAAESVGKALDLIKAEPVPSDPAAQARFNTNKLSALSTRAETMRLYVTKADQSQVDAGAAAYEEYIAAETDAAKKSKAEHDMAQMLFDANSYDRAKAAYEKILAGKPDDADAIFKLGLILYNLGFAKEAEGKKDEAKVSYQEAANYLQRFVDVAPEGNQLKTDAKSVLENLKNQQNVQAEKTTTTPRRRRP